MTNSSVLTTILFLIVFSNLGTLGNPVSEGAAVDVIERQFKTIRDVVKAKDHLGKKHLVMSMPEMPGRWEEVFGEGNYNIVYAMTDINTQNVMGVVDFLMPLDPLEKSRKRRMLTNVKLKKDEVSRSGYGMTIEKAENTVQTRQKRDLVPADDCECCEWGCMDG